MPFRLPLLSNKLSEAVRAVPESVNLAPATVHRLLCRHDLMGKKAYEPTSKDRRRFAFDKANELWMSDVMHGPSVFADGKRKRKTYLIATLDDATRVVPYAAFAMHENTAAFLPVLQTAILRRSIPKRLYVDNGSAYRSQHLALVCAKLGITLIHARPYQPSGQRKTRTLVSHRADATSAHCQQLWDTRELHLVSLDYMFRGASSGFGREFARELAREGFKNVVVVARREERLR